MRLDKEWAEVWAGKETEKLSVSGQAIEKRYYTAEMQHSYN